jgi:uncharacterized peroxidase-related enzyme
MKAATSHDARVPLVERDQVPPAVADLYDKLYADRGVVPNMFKALSNVPPLVLGIAAMLKPLMAEGALSGWFKELIATHVAALNECDYCVSAHSRLALLRGATEEQLAGLGNFDAGPFTEKEKTAFRYATLLHGSGNAIDDAAYAALSAHFSFEEIVELTAVAAAFEFFPRINSALRVPVTPLPEDLPGDSSPASNTFC